MRSTDFRRTPFTDWMDGLENRCVVCGGPQLGVHYHESEYEEE